MRRHTFIESVSPQYIGTNNTISIIDYQEYQRNDTEVKQNSGKRTVQVNVKMSAEDLETLQMAADTAWPEAILSRSGIILGLAKIAAKEILKKKPPRSRK